MDAHPRTGHGQTADISRCISYDPLAVVSRSAGTNASGAILLLRSVPGATMRRRTGERPASLTPAEVSESGPGCEPWVNGADAARLTNPLPPSAGGRGRKGVGEVGIGRKQPQGSRPGLLSIAPPGLGGGGAGGARLNGATEDTAATTLGGFDCDSQSPKPVWAAGIACERPTMWLASRLSAR